MADLPRLAVTREEAEQVVWHGTESPWGKGCALRLSERPTMPCQKSKCRFGERQHNVSISEGARVEVGWWAPNEPDAIDGIVYHWSWHSVATATLAEVWGDIDVPEDEWIITLTDVEVTDE